MDKTRNDSKKNRNDDVDVDKSPQRTPNEPSPPKKKKKTTQQITPKINIQIPKGFNMKQFFNPPKNDQNTNNTNKNQQQSIQQQTQTSTYTSSDTTTNVTNIPPPKFKSPPSQTTIPPNNPRQKSKSNTKTKQKQNTNNIKANKGKTGNKTQTKTSIKPSATKLKKRPEPQKQTSTIIRIPGDQPPRWDLYDVNGQIVRDVHGKEKARIPADQIHIKVDNTNYIHVERFKHAVKTAERNSRKNQKSMEKLANTYQDVKHRENTIKQRDNTITRIKKEMTTLNDKLEKRRTTIRSRDMEIAEIKAQQQTQSEKMADVSQKLNQSRATISELTIDLNNANNANEILKKTNAKLEKTVNKLIEDNLKSAEEYNKLKISFKQVQNYSHTLYEKLEKQQERVRQQQLEITTVKQSNESLIKDKEEMATTYTAKSMVIASSLK